MKKNNVCPKCNGEFEKGLLGDRGELSALAGAILWGTKIGFFTGLHDKKTVSAYRCKNCGYIELYANQ